MTQDRIGEWREVDAAVQPESYTSSIDARNKLTDTRRYKDIVLRELNISTNANARVLEVGCAMGTDAAEMLEMVGQGGRVTAIDVSKVMISEAKRRFQDRRLKFLIEDAERLSFADCSFDRIRADRVLRHLEIDLALAELYRVTALGGVLVVNEPDWQSVMLETENPDLDRYLEAAMADEDDDPRCGRRLARLMRDAGFTQVKTTPYVLVSEHIGQVDEVYGLRRGVLEANPDETFSAADIRRWVEGADASSDEGKFLFGLPGFVVSGRRMR